MTIFVRLRARLSGWATRLMAVVAEGDRGRVYLAADNRNTKTIARQAQAGTWKPDCDDAKEATAIFRWYLRALWIGDNVGDLFTCRQLRGPNDVLGLGAGSP